VCLTCLLSATISLTLIILLRLNLSYINYTTSIYESKFSAARLARTTHPFGLIGKRKQAWGKI